MNEQLRPHKAVKLPAEAITSFNLWLASRITAIVGTMGCAYIFIVLTLPALPEVIKQAQAKQYTPAVTWVTQTFIQLVLLPIILVGQNLQAKRQDAKAEADHAALTHLANVVDLIAERVGVVEPSNG